LTVKFIGTDLKKKMLCINEGDGYGIVFLIGFGNNSCHFTYTQFSSNFVVVLSQSLLLLMNRMCLS
jgi:hypothetical protein